VKDLFLVESF